MGPGQDPETRPWQARRRLSASDTSEIKDLHGGWYDAGDYNKYTSWTARNVIVLLRAYSENPTAFGDDTGIEESGNGVPDILDEVKWALDWLMRMQNTDGSLLCVQGLDQASPPSAATGPSYYGPATTAASLMGAAAFAYAAKTYSARGRSQGLRRRSRHPRQKSMGLGRCQSKGSVLQQRRSKAAGFARTCFRPAGNGRLPAPVCEI